MSYKNEPLKSSVNIHTDFKAFLMDCYSCLYIILFNFMVFPNKLKPKAFIGLGSYVHER